MKNALVRVPGDVGVRLVDGELELQRWGRKRQSQPSTWTRVTIPVESDASLRVLAARPHEWLIDLVVCRALAGRLALEVWRISPFRVLRRWKVGALDPTERVQDEGAVTVMKGGFRFRGRNHAFLVRQAGFRADYRMYELDWYSYDVFLSFKDRDARLWAESLRDELEGRDLRVWFSPQEVRTNYDEAIRAGIERSASYAIIWSPSSCDRVSASGQTTGWTQAAELDQIKEMKARRKFHCVVDGGSVRKDLLEDRYQSIDLERVGAAGFADMILESFRLQVD